MPNNDTATRSLVLRNLSARQPYYFAHVSSDHRQVQIVNGWELGGFPYHYYQHQEKTASSKTMLIDNYVLDKMGGNTVYHGHHRNVSRVICGTISGSSLNNVAKRVTWSCES